MNWLGKARFTVTALAVTALAVTALVVTGLALVSTSSSWSAPAATSWPGGATVSTADASNVFGANLSGLSYQSAGVVWAVQNGPSKVYRLVPNGSLWQPDPSGGKTLRYSDGKGVPDAEGIVVSADGLVVSTERDDDDGDTSLPKVLRFDPASTASTLKATREWDLTSDLPGVGSNDGLEAISWIPDSFLTSHGFRDERSGAAYSPSSYPGHGTGLYFVGLEDNGTVYTYALNQSSNSYTRVASFTSGFSTVMDLEFDPAPDTSGPSATTPAAASRRRWTSTRRASSRSPRRTAGRPGWRT